MDLQPFLSDVWFVTWSKRSLQSNVSVKSNSCLSCPKLLVNTTIPLGQCGHFSQVGPFEKSCFLVVNMQVNKGWSNIYEIDTLPSPGLNPLEGPTMLSCGKLGLGRRSRLLALERGRGVCQKSRDQTRKRSSYLVTNLHPKPTRVGQKSFCMHLVLGQATG